jgi:hypothetical protein
MHKLKEIRFLPFWQLGKMSLQIQLLQPMHILYIPI